MLIDSEERLVVEIVGKKCESFCGLKKEIMVVLLS